MDYHRGYQARADLLGLASSQEVQQLGAGRGPFDCRDYYGDAGRQGIRELRVEQSRRGAEVGACGPKVMFTTTMRDDRVHPAMSTRQ